MMRAEIWIALWLLANLFAVGVWDVGVTFWANGNETVSAVIYAWCGRWPLLAAFMGGLVIHLLGLGPRLPLVHEGGIPPDVARPPALTSGH